MQRYTFGVDGWGLNLAFFMDTFKYWNDTTCIALEIPHIGSLTLIPIGGTPPLSTFMGHPFDKLELFVVRDAFFIWWCLKVKDHLWNHLLVWLIPCVGCDTTYMIDLSIKTISWTFAIFMSTTCRISLVDWCRHYLWISLEKLIESRFHLKQTN